MTRQWQSSKDQTIIKNHALAKPSHLPLIILALLFMTGRCAEPSSQHRRRVYFGSISSLTAPVIVASRKKAVIPQEYYLEQEEVSREGKLWPPWPFNLIGRRRQKSSAENGNFGVSGSLFWSYLRERARSGARQMQQVGSELWFHLPPATPPLLLLASIPRNKVVPSVFSNPFVRNLLFASFGVGIMSWAHSKLNKQRRLVLLPLPEHYRDIHKAVLPHFLPEQVPNLADISPVQKDIAIEPVKEKAVELSDDAGLSPKLRKHLINFYQSAPRPATLRDTFRAFGRLQESRKLDRERAHRATIYDELVALQALKRQVNQRKKRQQQQTSLPNPDDDDMGYALVTGASKGIGRALAVELARWEIPLILVARDVDKLTSLASDIERCYGIKCIVLPADLSKAGTAEKIHSATRGAGLRVDIVVNNAGISSVGSFVDTPVTEIQEIIQVNAVSVATLSHLYCKDMKERRRGRLLMVSSVTGSVPGSPNAACYAATKSFEKVLAVSMAKELEPFGVGVTCLMPGAVCDTSFRSTSQSDEALCWKLPFYPRSAQIVARQGVRAMLAGDVEVVPGWQNRIFLKVLQPILPPRVTTLMVEIAWSPFQLSFPSFRKAPKLEIEMEKPTSLPGISTGQSNWPGYTSRPPPRLIKLTDTTVDPQEESSSVVSVVPQSTFLDESTPDPSSKNMDLPLYSVDSHEPSVSMPPHHPMESSNDSLSMSEDATSLDNEQDTVLMMDSLI